MSDKKEIKTEELKQISGGRGDKICTDPNRGRWYYDDCTSPDKGQCTDCPYCRGFMHLEDQ